MKKLRTWTNREVAFLRAAYERGDPTSWIGQQLGGRSVSSVTGMAFKLGIKHPMPRAVARWQRQSAQAT